MVVWYILSDFDYLGFGLLVTQELLAKEVESSEDFFTFLDLLELLAVGIVHITSVELFMSLPRLGTYVAECFAASSRRGTEHIITSH